MTIVQIETEHYAFTLVPHSIRDRRQASKVRVYAPSIEPEMPQPPYSVKGEDPANDKAWRAYNREEVRLMKVELSKALAEVVELADKQDEGVWAPVVEALRSELRFSRKAGCSCGCSAGFVSDRRVALAGHGIIVQVSVNFKPAKPTCTPERTFTFADFDQAQ